MQKSGLKYIPIGRVKRRQTSFGRTVHEAARLAAEVFGILLFGWLLGVGFGLGLSRGFTEKCARCCGWVSANE